MDSLDKILNVLRARRHVGWFAIYKSGLLLLEGLDKWEPEYVVVLGLVLNGRVYLLPKNKTGYFQTRTASCFPGGETRLLSRNIGYMDGNQEVTMRVMEGSEDCILEIGGI